MILKVYSVFDAKTGAYMQPFFARADGEAIRMIQNSVSDPNSLLYRHPADFTLWRLSAFDDASGVFDGSPMHLSDVQSLVPQADLTEVSAANNEALRRAFAERN